MPSRSARGCRPGLEVPGPGRHDPWIGVPVRETLPVASVGAPGRARSPARSRSTAAARTASRGIVPRSTGPGPTRHPITQVNVDGACPAYKVTAPGVGDAAGPRAGGEAFAHVASILGADQGRDGDSRGPRRRQRGRAPRGPQPGGVAGRGRGRARQCPVPRPAPRGPFPRRDRSGRRPDTLRLTELPGAGRPANAPGPGGGRRLQAYCPGGDRGGGAGRRGCWRRATGLTPPGRPPPPGACSSPATRPA
jgi:hypothetical protein